MRTASRARRNSAFSSGVAVAMADGPRVGPAPDVLEKQRDHEDGEVVSWCPHREAARAAAQADRLIAAGGAPKDAHAFDSGTVLQLMLRYGH